MDGNDIRGKPVVVQYENGDVHHYSLASASKLTIVQRSSPRLSVVQGFVATPLMALYPLITKICLRFLHCERCPPCTLARMLDQCPLIPTLLNAIVSLAIARNRTLARPHNRKMQARALACFTGPRMASFCW
jgi:hypothetical protein